MTLEFRKLHPLFAAEVSAVDLRAVHDEETLERIRAGMDERAVLVFRDQAFSSEEQRDFATRLDGELHRKTGISVLQKSRFGDEAITDVSNVDASGEVLESDSRKRLYGLANRLWHTDASFQDPRGRYSMLAAVALPPVAADTEFADMRAAYDALADETKATLEGVRVHHSIAYSRITLGFDFSEEEKRPAQGGHPAAGAGEPAHRAALPLPCLPRVADPRPADPGWPAPPPRPHGACDSARVRLPAFVATRGLRDLGQPRHDASCPPVRGHPAPARDASRHHPRRGRSGPDCTGRLERVRLRRTRDRPRSRPAANAAPSRRRRPQAGCRERQIAWVFPCKTETP